jgi:chromosome partitioning protein
MSTEKAYQIPSARVIVVANEKGGSGKSTIAMHVTIALMKINERVATVDLDSRQKTFTHYIENRHDWARHIARDLEIPQHVYFVENMNHPTAEDEAADGKALADQIEALARQYNFVVIDTPGRNSYLGRLALSMANIVMTPLNDSFIDLDVLGTVDPKSLTVVGTSHYSQVVEEARRQRQLRDNVCIDWIVLRNRLSMLGSRNTRLVGEGLHELSQTLRFRCIEGIAERVVFREFYPRGLTAFDALDEITLGTRPTLSHVTARFEIENLVNAMRLRGGATASGDSAVHNRDAA